MAKIRKKKVIWISRSPNEIYLNLANNLAQYFEVTFICRRAAHLEQLQYQDARFKYEPLPYYNNVLNPFVWWHDIRNERLQRSNQDRPDFIWLKKLGEYLKVQKPDYVIANGLEQPSTWQAINYCRRTNTPLLLQTEMKRLPIGIKQSVGARILLLALQPAFAQAKAFLPWTKGAYIFAEKYLPNKTRKNLHLLPAGIDLKLFHSEPGRTRNHEPNIIEISLVARFVAYKRLFDAMEAVRMVRKKYRLDCRLSLVGQDQQRVEPLGDKIREYIKKNSLETIVTIKERIDRTKMSDFYQQHDINLLTSFDEPIGMVVPESMAVGVANIVSDTSGAATYITDQENGIIYPTGNIPALAAAIAQLANKQKREMMGRAAAKTIKDNYSVPQIGSQLADIILQ